MTDTERATTLIKKGLTPARISEAYKCKSESHLAKKHGVKLEDIQFLAGRWPVCGVRFIE